jgi:hypothetical protein
LAGFRGGYASPDTFYISANRAYAHVQERYIVVNSSFESKRAKNTVFHEISHIQEFQHLEIGKIATQWRDEKAIGEWRAPDGKYGAAKGSNKGKAIYRLSDITGNKSFGPKELAHADDYLSPYMGKVYEGGGTYSEVWSMAVEHFADPASMRKLYDKHPDLFEMVVGMSRMPP